MDHEKVEVGVWRQTPDNYSSYSSSELLRLVDRAINKNWTALAGAPAILCEEASKWPSEADIFVTDPPYGDAVKYEEILDFFIAWLRKNPPPEFADWVWDSRRSLAIKGEDEDFRREHGGGLQAHGRVHARQRHPGHHVHPPVRLIWADMANIVWAPACRSPPPGTSSPRPTAPCAKGSYVKGTVLLVLRKRQGRSKTTRDDLAWEIQEEVEAQVEALTGLNQEAKGLYRDENVFEDADIQMAGYAAALVSSPATP